MTKEFDNSITLDYNNIQLLINYDYDPPEKGSRDELGSPTQVMITYIAIPYTPINILPVIADKIVCDLEDRILAMIES